jgi:hypothetical protein
MEETLMLPSGVGKKGRILFMQRQSSKPKGNGGAVANSNLGDRPEGLKASNNVFPDGGVKEMRNSKFTSGRPAIPPKEPISPRGGGRSMQFSEEFGKESRVLGGDGEHPKATKLLRNTNVSPCHLALTRIACLFTGQKKARCLLSIASTTPGSKCLEPMA